MSTEEQAHIRKNIQEEIAKSAKLPGRLLALKNCDIKKYPKTITLTIKEVKLILWIIAIEKYLGIEYCDPQSRLPLKINNLDLFYAKRHHYRSNPKPGYQLIKGVKKSGDEVYRLVYVPGNENPLHVHDLDLYSR